MFTTWNWPYINTCRVLSVPSPHCNRTRVECRSKGLFFYWSLTVFFPMIIRVIVYSVCKVQLENTDKWNQKQDFSEDSYLFYSMWKAYVTRLYLALWCSPYYSNSNLLIVCFLIDMHLKFCSHIEPLSAQYIGIAHRPVVCNASMG